MASLLAIALAAVAYARYVPWIYWLTVVLVSIVGTQITDLLTDGLNVSLYASTAAFAVALAAIFFVWHRVEGTLSIDTIVTPRRELFYWPRSSARSRWAPRAISRPRRSAGFTLGALCFGGLIAAVFVMWRLGANAVLAFWIAYILTRPFGASLGDLLTQARTYGGRLRRRLDEPAVPDRDRAARRRRAVRQRPAHAGRHH